MSDQKKCAIVVLISGNGGNLQALINHNQSNSCPYAIKAVISNKADALGLQRAAKAGIASHTVNHQDFQDRQQFDQELKRIIESYNTELIVLAGFMRILSDDFVLHYQGRLINIHPSLLPKYKGLNTHQRVLSSDDRQHGASVHFVTPDLDDGPNIIQGIVNIDKTETEDSLIIKVTQQEHIIYPQAITWFAEKRLQMQDHTAILDNEVLPTSGKQLIG